MASDKSSSTTFQLVHRPQNDPKIHDVGSSSMVFQELVPSQAHKFKNRTDLESELFNASNLPPNASPTIRDNEGEAAEHGVFYDDTEYDYMQHIKDLNAGSGNGESFFVEAKDTNKERRGKTRMNLEEALRQSSIRDGKPLPDGSTAQNLLGEDVLPSKDLRSGTYQDQQDTPDALAGFQPDMDPRLREVLEALEDEAYVDEEEDFFGEIAKDRQELTLDEFEDNPFPEEEEDAGWESDVTEKAHVANAEAATPITMQSSEADTTMSDAFDHGDGNWMAEFSKFKQAGGLAKKAVPHPSKGDLQSSILTGTSMTEGRRKRRKGAMTSSTGYSMTSSSLFRTEGQTLLDARFDKIEEDYAADDTDWDDGSVSAATNKSLASGHSAATSQAPSLVRADFDNMMDDFLCGYSMSGKKRVKQGGYQSGMEQLDEVRKALGPARTQKAS